jgi:hypothetical protein
MLNWLQQVLSQEDYAAFFLRLFIDLLAVLLLGVAIFQKRHGRRDLVVAFLTFNVGLVAVMSVISTRHIGTGLGFGLFAMLSIIRLRSEPFDHVELGYFFGALVLALVNGIAKTDAAFSVVLSLLVISVAYLADHPSLHATVRRRRITLDTVETDAAALRGRLEAAHGIRIVDLAITQVDYVRDTSRVVIRYVDPIPGSSSLELADSEVHDDD